MDIKNRVKKLLKPLPEVDELERYIKAQIILSRLMGKALTVKDKHGIIHDK